MREQDIRDAKPGAPPAQPVERRYLSFDLVLDLVLCGVLLASLSLLAQHLQPDFPRGTLFAGLASGGLCALCGVLGARRPGGRVGAMVTLAAVTCVLVIQAVHSWTAFVEGESKGRMAAFLMTVLLVFCVGMLVNLARAGKGPQA